MNARYAYSSCLPSWKAPTMERGRKEAVRLSREVSWGCRRKNKRKTSQRCTQCMHPVSAECFASQTLYSAESGINLVHSFINAGYESLCLQVSFIMSLERGIKLLALNAWVWTVVRDTLSIRDHLVPYKMWKWKHRTPKGWQVFLPCIIWLYYICMPFSPPLLSVLSDQE